MFAYTWQNSNLALKLLFAMVALNMSSAQAQTWTDWEQQHAVGKFGQFLVFQNPDEEGLCFLKQSYADQPTKMELMTKGDGIRILNPFFDGFSDDVRYWVDEGTKFSLPASVGTGFTFELSELSPEALSSGSVLNVEVSPQGQFRRLQKFPLTGFFEAYETLIQSPCPSQ